jgi:alkylated DNA repair dioxygenase AlkB
MPGHAVLAISVLLNFYRNGQDSVAWHADDEKELGPEPVIASVSFGAERRFQLKPKSGNNHQRYQLQLLDGSLLIMGNTLQNNWMHQLPKMKGLDLPRINLTFRTIV